MTAKYPSFFDQLPSSRSYSRLKFSFYFSSPGLTFHLFSAIFAHIHPHIAVEQPSKVQFHSANSTDSMADSIRIFPNVGFKLVVDNPPPGAGTWFHSPFFRDPCDFATFFLTTPREFTNYFNLTQNISHNFR